MLPFYLQRLWMTRLPFYSRPISYRLLALSLSLLLISCGGGGGGGGGGGESNGPNISPIANFTVSINPTFNSLTVALNALSSTDSDGSISRYSWDFGDGSNGAGANTSYEYAAGGNYTIELTVTDNQGATDSTEQTVNLNEIIAQINLSRLSSGVIEFDGTGSRAEGTSSPPSIQSYSWDFGDGATATGPIVTHSYTPGGTYYATLTVTDSAGASDVARVPTTFDLSGRVYAASNTGVDVDVNEPSRQNKLLLGANFQTNNDSTEAQLLPNPVLINGFVNSTGTGAPPAGVSNFSTDTDTDDFYSAVLLEDQFVSLRIADFNPLLPLQNDIDLFLYDSDLNLVAFSATALGSEYESVMVPADGQYFIRVEAVSGISKYLLNIGSNSFASGLQAYGNSANIIAGEAIVKAKPQQLQAASTNRTNQSVQSLTGMSHSNTDRPALMRFSVTGTAASQSVSARSSLSNLIEQKNGEALQTLRKIRALNRHSGVEYAEPNFRVKPLLAPNDSFYSFQWHYPQINLPQAWDITTGNTASSPVIVAVVDTGVILNHEDFAGKLVAGYDFIRDTETSNDGNGIDSNADDPGDGDGVKANSWHGTHVAGTVAAATNNNLGVAGVSWGAQIMPIRVLGKGGGSSYDVVQGIRFAAGLSNDSGTLPAQAADVINLSLGGSGFSQSTQNLFNQLRSNGTIVIAAAGNESTSSPSYPASYDNVISVSATDLDNSLAPYSNFGEFIDVAAPGGNASVDRNGDGYNDGVLSTLFDDESNRESYAFYEGTSMASPHVAGVAALMKDVFPALTADDFTASLQNGSITSDIGTSGRDDLYGYGIIDALKAVQQAQLLAGGNASGAIFSAPNRVDFGTTANSRSLTLTGIGTNPPTVLGVTSSAPWLSINNSSVNADGTGDYVLNVNRSGLVDAVYQGSILVDIDSGNDLTIPISLQVQNTILDTADTGYLFLLLLDADSFEFVAQVDVDIVNGNYLYFFDSIPYGEYILIAGSDIDNDFIICGIGESCGNYPTNEQPLRIVVDQTLTDLNFLASMVSDIISGSSATSNNSSGYSRHVITSETEANKQLAE